MNQERIDSYFNKILPHYKAMAENSKVRQIDAKLMAKSNADNPEGLSFFCTQWGEDFDRGILFVGRATNGWGGGINPDNLHTTFTSDKDGDHLRWVGKGWNNPRNRKKDGKIEKLWAGKRSAFWRLIRKITEHYHKENWVNHIAWTNLAKCAPSGKGNPSECLWRATQEQNKGLMRIDIEMLDPQVVVFITLGWGDVVFKSIVGNAPCRQFESHGYTIKTWRIDNRLLIVCERPEGRKEDSLAKCVCDAIDEFKGTGTVPVL